MSTHKRTSKRRQGMRLTPDQRQVAQETFLQAFASSGNIRASCMAAGIDRSTVREWEEHDDTFGFRYRQAALDVDDLIDAELFRRGVHGEKEPVVSMGRVVRDDETGEILTVTKRSDQILMFIAKARMSKYREKQQIEHSGPNGGPIQTHRVGLKALTDEELMQLEEMARKVQADEEIAR